MGHEAPVSNAMINEWRVANAVNHRSEPVIRFGRSMDAACMGGIFFASACNAHA